MVDWLKRAQEAYEASSAFIDTNYRSDWEYSLKAFRNEHAPGSKYLSEEYKARSRIFKPKTRSIIRKNEAAAAVALFSNMEVVNVTPGNPDDPMSVASSEAMKQILEHRLTKTIPSFQVCMGAVQDAQVTGAVVSYNYWEYQKRGEKIIKDKPCIELRPIENIRLDGGASWLDPVNSSPYFCDIIPMYVCDVKGMMDSQTYGQPWKKYDDKEIAKARPDDLDSTRKARLGEKQDPQEETTGIKDYDVVWVMRWFMRDSISDDYTFYTLGTEQLLTDPVPVEQVYFHGVRPYTMGCAILESHKVFKTPLPILIKPLQQESTDVSNQRLDNVKFVLNKRWIVARGRQVDVQSLVRNVPGGVTLATDPRADVQESNWPDVTSSSYAEQDRIDAALDDLAGNFSPSTRVANNAINDTLGGSKLATQSAGIMTDYLLRTIIETWWEPTLRQLVMLEQQYETDEMVLAVCAQKARLFPKFGISRITDYMLANEVNVSVNVGMGSSNPQQRQQNFLAAATAANQLIATAPPGVNVEEQIKEIYSNAGYRDGARFYKPQKDPQLMKAMQMIQQLQSALNGKQMEIQAGMQETQMKLASNERIKGAELQVDSVRISGDLRIREAELLVEQKKIELEQLKLQMEIEGKSQENISRAAQMQYDLAQAELKLEGERRKQAADSVKQVTDIQKSALDLQAAKQENTNGG